MPRANVSRILQSYLRVLTEQARHYATLRLFDGLAPPAGGLCLDAQVLALLASKPEPALCSLTAFTSYRKDGTYHQDLLYFAGQYEPNEVMKMGPARWHSSADLLAYQLVAQLVLWQTDKEAVTFIRLEATTGLKPDRQRFYL